MTTEHILIIILILALIFFITHFRHTIYVKNTSPYASRYFVPWNFPNVRGFRRNYRPHYHHHHHRRHVYY